MTGPIDVDTLERRFERWAESDGDTVDYELTEIAEVMLSALRQQQEEIKNLIRDFCNETETLGQMNVALQKSDAEIARLRAAISTAPCPVVADDDFRAALCGNYGGKCRTRCWKRKALEAK